MSRVRIVGGQWRSRLLDVTAVPGLRPTPDRVRETLFNWLGQRVDGLRCLDLFAGTGVLGFEAASRGAAEVIMVESNPRAVRGLEAAREVLDARQVRIRRGDALEFARSATPLQQFDIVFLDPPYGPVWFPRIPPCLGGLVRPAGWLYVEDAQAHAALGAWQTVRQGRAGQVHFHLMQGSSNDD